MNELLSNPAVQTALVLVIVTALNGLVAWLKSRFPTQAKIVDNNWSYLQPIVGAAMSEARITQLAVNAEPNALSIIVTRSLAEFADMYRRYEAAEPSETILAAARKEIAEAVTRAADKRA